MNTHNENPLRYFSHIELESITEDLKKEAEYIKTEIIKESAKGGNRIIVKQLSIANEEYLISNGFSVISLTTEYLISWPKKSRQKVLSYRESPIYASSLTNSYSSVFNPKSISPTQSLYSTPNPTLNPTPNQISNSEQTSRFLSQLNSKNDSLDVNELRTRVNNIANLADRLVEKCNEKTSGINRNTYYSNQIFDFTKPDMYKK